MNKNLLSTILLLLFVCIANTLLAQIGGDNTYEFINLSPSAQITALGGTLISVKDDDLTLGYQNPSLLHDEMHQQISIHHNLFLDGIQHGFAGYSFHSNKLSTSFMGGLQYVSYGTFDSADERGNITGTFEASEYGFTVGGARQLYEKVRIGANLKFVASQFEAFNSYGLLADLGAYYQDTTGTLSMGLVFKNVGMQLSTYEADNREPLGFEIQFGISKELKYLPFRVSVTAHNLQRWNILYDDPNRVETVFLLGNQEPNDDQFKDIVDNFFRHIIFSGEFILGKKDNFRIRVGYNHFRRAEMTVNNLRSLAGFSAGVGLKINRFKLSYGRSVYHIVGGSNHISITTNLKEFSKN